MSTQLLLSEVLPARLGHLSTVLFPLTGGTTTLFPARWANTHIRVYARKKLHTHLCLYTTTSCQSCSFPHVPPSGVRDLVLWSWSCVYRASQSLCLANEACDDGLLWKIFNFINLSWINDSFVLYQLNPKYIKLKQIGQSIHYWKDSINCLKLW